MRTTRPWPRCWNNRRGGRRFEDPKNLIKGDRKRMGAMKFDPSILVGAGSKPAPVSMRLNQYGNIVHQTWMDLPNHNSDIRLGEFMIMPNHVHFIIWIIHQTTGVDLEPGAGAGFEPAPTALPEIARQFKTFSSRRINELRHTAGQPLRQRNYYERFASSATTRIMSALPNFILANPLNWEKDQLFV